MKEILHDWMFKSGSYISQPKHAALYEALEVSMDHDNKDEFIEATIKSRKRHRDDQDPPPPPLKDSNQSKKKRQDSDASASKQPQAQTSSAWKTFDIREARSSSSKQKTIPCRLLEIITQWKIDGLAESRERKGEIILSSERKMRISFCSVKSLAVNISKSSTNKAFRTLEDSLDLESSLDYFHKLFTLPFIILKPDSILPAQIVLV
nr:hypothetical protein [Tanacetum cinerariifolium]